MIRMAILGSGNGSNAENLLRKCPHHLVEYTAIITDNPEAGILARAQRLGVPTKVFPRREFATGVELLAYLHEERVEALLLAGFLSRIPEAVVAAYPNRILNIHPALLPRFGGKGMYGSHVHQAVLEQGETVSGITIHYVDQVYDHGSTLCQATCPVLPNDTPETLAERVHHLEYLYYPIAVEHFVAQLPSL